MPLFKLLCPEHVPFSSLVMLPLLEEGMKVLLVGIVTIFYTHLRFIHELHMYVDYDTFISLSIYMDWVSYL